jgi:hypothetical protein
MRRAVAIVAAALAIMGAKLSCATSEGQPVHSRIWWISHLNVTGWPFIILKPGQQPPAVEIHGKKIPGTWQKRGNTYLGDHVWEWRPGHPNGSH